MRIISGILKGRPLKFPRNIRPTQNKIRKAVFDCLGDTINNSLFLELFAGSGAVGIEAVSCGAKNVTFVESSAACLKIIESNLKALGISAYQIVNNDSLKYLDYIEKKSLTYDLIFLDPPYRQELVKKCLLKIGSSDILTHSGIVIVEHHQKEELPQQEGSLMLFKQKHYGDTVLSFYREKPVTAEHYLELRRKTSA